MANKEDPPKSLTNIVEHLSDMSDKVKNCVCEFKMTEANWGLCRSAFVFCVGVILTFQLRPVAHEFLN